MLAYAVRVALERQILLMVTGNYMYINKTTTSILIGTIVALVFMVIWLAICYQGEYETVMGYDTAWRLCEQLPVR